MSYEEKLATVKHLTDYRESEQFDVDFPNRRHYRPQLGELRFDRVVGEQKQIVHFREVLTRDRMEQEKAKQKAELAAIGADDE